MPTLRPLIRLVYPAYTALANSIQYLPLKARNLLIKQCQSQTDFSPQFSPDCTLLRLLHAYGEVAVPDPCNPGCFSPIPLEFLLFRHNISVNDPLRAAIVLDLLRGCPVSRADMENFKLEGWIKEINLAVNPSRPPEVNFRPFFKYSLDPIHLRDFEFQERGHRSCDPDALRFSGQSMECNWDRRLALLEKLGYVEKVGVSVKLEDEAALTFWRLLVSKSPLPPGVFTYTCVKDIPEHFVF